MESDKDDTKVEEVFLSQKNHRSASDESRNFRSLVSESAEPPKKSPTLPKKKRTRQSKEHTLISLSNTIDENLAANSKIFEHSAILAKQAQAAGFSQLASAISQAVLKEFGSCENSPEIRKNLQPKQNKSPPKCLRPVLEIQRKSITDMIPPKKISTRSTNAIQTPTSQLGISPRRMLIDVLGDKTTVGEPEFPAETSQSDFLRIYPINAGSGMKVGTAQFLDHPEPLQIPKNPFKDSLDFATIQPPSASRIHPSQHFGWSNTPPPLIGITDAGEDQSFILFRKESELPGEFELDSFLQSTRYIFEGGSQANILKPKNGAITGNTDSKPLNSAPLSQPTAPLPRSFSPTSRMPFDRRHRLVSAENWSHGPETEEELRELGIQKDAPFAKNPPEGSCPFDHPVPEPSWPPSQPGSGSRPSHRHLSTPTTPKGPTLVPISFYDKAVTPESTIPRQLQSKHEPRLSDATCHIRAESNHIAVRFEQNPANIQRLSRSDKLKDLKEFVQQFKNYKSSRVMKVQEFTLPHPSVQEESHQLSNHSRDKGIRSLRSSLRDEHNLYHSGRNVSVERKSANDHFLPASGKFPGESFQTQTERARPSQEKSVSRGLARCNIALQKLRLLEERSTEKPEISRVQPFVRVSQSHKPQEQGGLRLGQNSNPLVTQNSSTNWPKSPEAPDTYRHPRSEFTTMPVRWCRTPT